MPSQHTSSSLLAKYKAQLQKAHEEAKDLPVEVPVGGDLPAGIEGGIAQLVELKFDKYKKGDHVGEPYFYAAGVVVKPKEFNGQYVEGLRTSIMEALCPTPGRARETVGDHWKWILNQLKLLGLEDLPDDPEDVEQVFQELVDEGPHFRFRTWKGQPQKSGKYKDVEPRVNHVWLQAVPFEEAADEAVETGQRPAVSNGKGKAAASVAAAAKAPVKATKPVPPPTEDVEQTVEELVEIADSEDPGADDARVELAQRATAVGVPESKITKAKNWAAVGAMIAAATPAPDEDEEDEEKDDAEVEEDEETEEEEVEEEDRAPAIPEKGKVYGVLLTDPKTKKVSKKPTDCEVLKVDVKKETCDVKNLDDDKVHKNVAWAAFALDD